MNNLIKLLLVFLLSDFSYTQILKKKFPGEGTVDIIENLGSPILLEAEFLNENGEKVVLKDFFSKNIPTIITLNYFECPMLCTLVLNGLGDSLKNLSLKAGNDYQIITIDINPHETYQLAHQTKKNYVQKYGIDNLNQNWSFLTGTNENIKKIINFPNIKHFKEIFEINEFSKEELKNKKKKDKKKFEISKYWIAAQNKINLNKKIKFLNLMLVEKSPKKVL